MSIFIRFVTIDAKKRNTEKVCVQAMRDGITHWLDANLESALYIMNMQDNDSFLLDIQKFCLCSCSHLLCTLSFSKFNHSNMQFKGIYVFTELNQSVFAVIS